VSAPVVLVHGGAHGAWCWAPLLAHLEAIESRVSLHQRLLDERTRLHTEIEDLTKDGVRSDSFQDDETDAVDQHPADDASELFERE